MKLNFAIGHTIGFGCTPPIFGETHCAPAVFSLRLCGMETKGNRPPALEVSSLEYTHRPEHGWRNYTIYLLNMEVSLTLVY